MNKTLINVKAYTKDGNCVIDHTVTCETSHSVIDFTISKERKACYMKYRVVRIVFDIAYPQQ